MNFIAMKFIRNVFICLALFSMNLALAESREMVKIGVLAKRGVEKSLLKWEATAQYLNTRFANYEFKIIPMKFDQIPILVKNQLVDFVIVNSAIYVDLNIKYEVRRILTLNNHLAPGMDLTQFGSVIFSHTDRADLNELADLKGQRVAAVHETSLGGWMMALREMRAIGLDKSDLRQVDFLQTHDAVVRSVMAKSFDIGIVRTDTLERMQGEGKVDMGKVKIINPQDFPEYPFHISTRLYPEWPIAKLKHTSGDLAKKISFELMQMKADSQAAIAARIKGWTIPENYIPVHEILKELEVGPYKDINKITLTKVIQNYRYPIIIMLLVVLVLTLMTMRIMRLNQQLKIEQKNLQHSQESLKATFEQAAVGLIHIGAEGEILRVNQRFCDLVGYTEWELKNINLMDISHSEDLGQELQLMEEVRLGRRESFSIQKRFVHKDSRNFWSILTISCIRDENGVIKFMVAVVDDVSKLKELEQDLRINKKQQELILHLAGDGILGLDHNANHTFVNRTAAKLLGYSQEEMLGKNSHQMWHHTRSDGSPYPHAECPIAAVLNRGETHRGSHELFWRKDGSSFYADYISTPIIEDDVITGAVVLFHEIVDLSVSSRTNLN